VQKDHEEDLGINFSRATAERLKHQAFLRGQRIEFRRFSLPQEAQERSWHW
jgi:hypothetical protein